MTSIVELFFTDEADEAIGEVFRLSKSAFKSSKNGGFDATITAETSSGRKLPVTAHEATLSEAAKTVLKYKRLIEES